MRLPRLGRSASLRTRVALAAAAAAAAVVAVFTVLTSLVLANNDAAQLDRRLDSIIDASVYDQTNGVLQTGRSRSTGQVVFQRGLQLPQLPPGTETVEVNGIEYRVRTIPVDQQGGLLMSVGIRANSILLNRARIPLYTAVGVVTVLIAGGLGWMLAGPAIRPLRRLTEQTMKLGEGSDRMTAVKGAREAEELSDAMADMLDRLAAAKLATTNSLQAAQDFAANAAHELRTPLTAMRADLDTLRIHDLPADERDEVVGDLARAQRRVEAIITALGQLASGQLAQDEDRELIDVTDLLDRVARENARAVRRGNRRTQRRCHRRHLGLAGWIAARGGQPGAQCPCSRRGQSDRVDGRPDSRGRGPRRDALHRRRRRRVRTSRPRTPIRDGEIRPWQYRGAWWLGPRPRVGGSAGGTARGRHRVVGRSARRSARHPHRGDVAWVRIGFGRRRVG